MGKIQTICKFIKPMIDDVAKLATKPNQTINVFSDAITQGSTFINCSKLGDDIVKFIGESIEKFSKYKDSLGANLHKKIENAIINQNFQINDIVTKHYSKLAECKNLDDVMKFYPEIHLPNMTPKSALTEMISNRISQSKLVELQNFAKEGSVAKIDDFLESIISPQFKTTAKYNDIKPLLAEIRDSIVNKSFNVKRISAIPQLIGQGTGLNTFASLYDDNFEEVILEMLKRNYINGENIKDIVVNSAKGVKVSQASLSRGGYKISGFDSRLKKYIDTIETNVSKLLLSNMNTKEELMSSALKKAWKAGSLKYDLKGLARHWKILDKVIAKNSQKAGAYTTDQLIDGYVLYRYRTIGQEIIDKNPYAKYIDGLQMNDRKKNGLELLYSMAKQTNSKDFQNIRNSDAFKAYKAQLDVEGMKASIEALEQHYQKGFFKIFWSRPERKATFSQALKEASANINENFELTEELLEKAASFAF